MLKDGLNFFHAMRKPFFSFCEVHDRLSPFSLPYPISYSPFFSARNFVKGLPLYYLYSLESKILNLV